MLLAFNAKKAKTSLECFDLFFTNKMIEKTVVYTNGSIKIVLDQLVDTIEAANRNTYFRLVDLIDIKSFLGILYFRAALGLNHESSHEILLQLCLGTDSTSYAKLLLLMKNQEETIHGRMISLLA